MPITKPNNVIATCQPEVCVTAALTGESSPQNVDSYVSCDCAGTAKELFAVSALFGAALGNAAGGTKGQAELNKRIERADPLKWQFIKDAPILVYEITTPNFEDIPPEISRHLGAVDQTQYSQEYLANNIGGAIALQMNGEKPDFYIISKDVYGSKYKPAEVSAVRAKNPKLLGKLSNVEGVATLIEAGSPGLKGALKTSPVDMIRMSDLGYDTAAEVTIESPWGEQTKPAGADAFLVFDTGANQYYMVNSTADGNPISYIPTSERSTLHFTNAVARHLYGISKRLALPRPEGGYANEVVSAFKVYLLVGEKTKVRQKGGGRGVVSTLRAYQSDAKRLFERAIQKDVGPEILKYCGLVNDVPSLRFFATTQLMPTIEDALMDSQNGETLSERYNNFKARGGVEFVLGHFDLDRSEPASMIGTFITQSKESFYNEWNERGREAGVRGAATSAAVELEKERKEVREGREERPEEKIEKEGRKGPGRVK